MAVQYMTTFGIHPGLPEKDWKERRASRGNKTCAAEDKSAAKRAFLYP
jgi:hypothetical protein